MTLVLTKNVSYIHFILKSFLGKVQEKNKYFYFIPLLILIQLFKYLKVLVFLSVINRVIFIYIIQIVSLI